MPGKEFSLIQQYFSGLGSGQGVVRGVGDDAAILRLDEGEELVASVDTQVQGVHFPVDSDAADIAYRAVAAAASDLAASGARPLAMTLALTLPAADDSWLAAFSRGLSAAAATLGLPLVGGDTTRGPLCLSVQVMGAVPAGTALTRDGAAPGEKLCVSGELGDAAAALDMLQQHWQPSPGHAEYLRGRFYRPTPRLQLGQELRGLATAAIDISDGLLADAGHIAVASGVGLQIDPERLPLSAAVRARECAETARRWALSGGEDFELLFCLPARAPLPAGCTCIGSVVSGQGVEAGSGIDFQRGYQHF